MPAIANAYRGCRQPAPPPQKVVPEKPKPRRPHHKTGPNSTWTADEDERLIAMRKEGLLFREIAERLGRSTGAVCEHYNRIMGNIR